MRTQYSVLSILIVLLLLGGCATNRATSLITPGTDLSSLNKFYVIKLTSDRRDVNTLISNRLNELGHHATTGPKESIPENIDAIVTYRDKWMWDITMYMLELTITFRDPDSEFPLAEGNSIHTSLTRKSPGEMVDEVLTNIFSGKTDTK